MKNLYFVILLGIFLAGCRGTEELPSISEKSNITGLATPVKLDVVTTEIPLSDFYLDPSIIEKVSIIGLGESQYKLENNVLIVEPSDDMDAMMSIAVNAGGITEYIPLIKSGKQAVEMTYDPRDVPIKSVTVKGEFNGWTPGRPDFVLEDGIWKARLMLNPGSYQYLLVVDGREMFDPLSKTMVDNNMGGYNALLTIGLELAEKVPVLFTDKYSDGKIELGYERVLEGVMIFWQNVMLPEEYYTIGEDGKIDLNIPSFADRFERSFIRVWAWNESGLSNDLLIPLENGKVLANASKLTRNDQHAMILYNTFIDRFVDADPSNNRPLNDPEVLPPADYHGGDIKGITQKIRDGYFADLGVNTIWISPVVKNPEGAYGFWPDPPSKFSGYHGYWPISFTIVDDRYGTEEDLEELVQVAHESDMNVLLDFVANHVHKEHPVYIEHPEWATELYLPDGSLNTEKWDEHRLTTWFDVFLPTLDLAKPEVYEMLSDSALYWIKKYNFDGFRHDATKHIPEVFWRALTRKLKTQVVEREGRPIYQLGETYGGPDLISSYIGSGMLDAQFDFNVYDDALAVIIRPDEPFSRLDASMHESMQYYGNHNLMGYITGNQDRGRFTSYAGAGLLFKEDAKLAGWTRKIEVGDKRGYLSTNLLFVFNMTIPGLPVIYYGDEIGMAGGNDPDSRRMMRFEDLSTEEITLKENVEKLTALRKNNLPLIYGDFETLWVGEQTYAYCRTYFDEIVIVVMSKSSQTKNLTFELPNRFRNIQPVSHFNTRPGVMNAKLSVTLGPREFDVYSATK